MDCGFDAGTPGGLFLDKSTPMTDIFKAILLGTETQRFVLVILLFFTVLVSPIFAQDQPSGKALIEALRKGGYNIYFRHAATDWSQQDHVAVKGDVISCDPARMRQLSAEGRATAQQIGAAIKRLNIPVGRVLSSPYCRTRQTAEIMDLGSVSTTIDIMNMRAVEFFGGRENVVNRARRVLATPPAPGTNTVLVAHGNLMQAATGAYTDEAGAGIFAPKGDGTFALVAELTPKEWQLLARMYAAAPDAQ